MEHETDEFDFDMLTTTDSIRILKPLIPYLPDAYQKHLALFIKFKELLYVSSSFAEIQSHFCSKKLENIDFSTFKRYCSNEQLEIINQMESMKSTFELYSQYTQMMSQMNPDAFTTEQEHSQDSAEKDTSPDSMSATIMNFLSEEQRAMYEKFSQS